MKIMLSHFDTKLERDRQTDGQNCYINASPYCAIKKMVQLVEYRTRNQEVVGSTHTRSTASNLEQVANLL